MTYADFISIHAPHAGRDQCVVGQKNARRNFNPRAPCGARPPKGGTKVVTDRFQSTRPMRGATDRRPRTADRVSISIHAPHAGRDNLRMRSTVPNQHFNPRAPCGARRNSCILSKISHHFNPRAPCGARRTPISSIRRRESDFNPRAPCGARHKEMRGIINGLFISIHAPHAGRDARCKSNTHRINISIHAPHAGRDPANSSTTAPCREHFNPRAPCGARRLKLLLWCRTIHFNPRAPCGARQKT